MDLTILGHTHTHTFVSEGTYKMQTLNAATLEFLE